MHKESFVDRNFIGWRKIVEGTSKISLKTTEYKNFKLFDNILSFLVSIIERFLHKILNN